MQSCPVFINSLLVEEFNVVENPYYKDKTLR